MGINRPDTEADAEAFVEAARHFKDILADTSSLIVLADIGALETAASLWRLATIAEAAEEARPELRAQLGITEQQGGALDPADSIARPLIRIVPASHAAPTVPSAKGPITKGMSTDQKLVETAKAHRWPVLAEDRKILIAAEEAGLVCFDCLVAIELFKALSDAGQEAYPRWHRRITERNTYTAYRRSWAEQIAIALQKLM
ncbi:MAG: hypothetical protein LDL24_09465 [Treponema sp.]|nr:hypothetical protein [Treponema sp.]